MATYKVTAPDGRSVTLTGDAPPTEQELEQVFKELPQQEATQSSPLDSVISAGKDSLMKLAGSAIPAMGALQAAGSYGKLAQQEEAAIANPLLEIQSGNMDLNSLLQSAGKGISGQSESPYNSGRQAELGDVYRNLGLPETVASTAGLLSTSVLPSQIGMGKLLEDSSKAIQATGKKLSPVAKDFLGTFERVAADASRSKTTAAETLESFTNIPSDVVMYAFDNPHILTKENARPEMVGKIADEVANGTVKLLKKNPNALAPNENIPYEIAKGMTDQFSSMLDDAGKRVVEAKNALKADKAPKMFVMDLDGALKNSMSEYLNDSGKIKEIFSDNKVATTLQEMRDKLYQLGQKNIEKGQGKRLGRLTLEDIMDFKKAIRDVAFRNGTTDANGIQKPLPEVQRALQQVYGYANDMIRRNYKDNPKLLEAMSEYSNLADVRSELYQKFKNPEKLATFLRNYDKKMPEQMNEMADLVSVLPNGKKYLNQIGKYIGDKTDSISNTFKFIDSGSKEKIQEGFQNILKKNFDSMTDLEKNKLDQLGKLIGVDISGKYTAHKVAEAFSGKTNFFRAIASGGVLAGVTGVGTGNPLAAATSFGLGMAATDPRIVGSLIRNAPRGTVPTLLNSATKTPPNIQSSILTNLIRRGQTTAEELINGTR